VSRAVGITRRPLYVSFILGVGVPMSTASSEPNGHTKNVPRAVGLVWVPSQVSFSFGVGVPAQWALQGGDDP